MVVTLEIPDDVAERMGGDLSRRALEALALEAYRAERITKPQLRRLLGFSTRYALDGFLKEHNVYDGPTFEDVQRDLQDLAKAGF
jgi:hypothetical protein